MKTTKGKAKGNGQTVALKDAKELDARVKGLFDKSGSYKQKKFLTAFAVTGQILKASELSGVSFQAHFYWKRKDPDYPALFDAAREIALDLAESEVFRRGIAGYEKFLSYKGKKGDQVTEYSDNLAMFFIKGYRSHFRDGIGGSVIGPSQINLTVSVDSPKLSTLPANDVTKTLPEPDTVTTQSSESQASGEVIRLTHGQDKAGEI